MKELLSKEYYCYKIHTLLMKSSAYPHPSRYNSSIWNYRAQCKKNIMIINATVSELDLTVQSSVIVNNVMIKVTCTWTIMKLRMKIMIVKVAQKMNNLLDMI